MLKLKEFVTVLIIVYLINACTCKPKSYTVKAIKFLGINANPKYVESSSFSIKTHSRTVQSYNATITFKPNVSIDWLHDKVTTYYKFADTFNQTLINEEVDICDIFSGFGTSQLISTDIPAKNNVVNGCPYEDKIYIENYEMSFAAFPDFLPGGIWRLDHEFVTMDDDEQEEPIITVQMYFKIRNII